MPIWSTRSRPNWPGNGFAPPCRGADVAGGRHLSDIAEPGLLASIAALPLPFRMIHADAVASAPEAKGAYLLLMHFGAPISFMHKRGLHLLDAGWYAYAGSAYGPGGIRARLSRHFRRDKKLHWHVDHLSVIAQEIQAATLEGGSECEIVAELVHSGSFRHALEGFGSSDCNRCRSHLLEWRS